jgi:hypothetical protein
MKDLIPLFLLCTIGLAGCGSGGGNGNSSISGNWQILLTNPATGAVKDESGFLLQSGNSLAGNVLLTGSTICPGVGAAQGRVTGSGVSLTVIQIGQTISLTGTSSGNGSQLGGNYSILASPCGTTQVGVWIGTQIPALSGNIQATFTSGTTPGQVIHFGGTISQGPNTGGSTTTLSGMMTSTDSPCFSSAAITGQISGTAVLLNLATSEGATIGQFIGKAATDATSVSGTYDFFPHGATPCFNYGTATIAVQGT